MVILYFLSFQLYFELCLITEEGSMSFLQKLFASQTQSNAHKNHVAWIANHGICKTNEQLLQTLANSQDEDVIKGITQILISRGFSRKELTQRHT